MLEDHVRVAGEEDYEVDLLGFVGDADHVLVGEDLQQQHQHRDEVQEVADQLEHVHLYNYSHTHTQQHTTTAKPSNQTKHYSITSSSAIANNINW
jgi:hypothetical protein